MQRARGGRVLIANPIAGRKLGLSTNDGTPEDAQRALERHGVAVDVHLTERSGHATELARAAAAAGARLVVVAGGDGTVREVATGLIGSATVLGILPLGSVMNVARSLNIPRDLDGAAEVIRAGRVARMDVGKATTSAGEAFFLAAAGVGADAGIFTYANRLDNGEWESFLRLLRFVRRYRPQPLALRVDHRTVDARACFSVTVAIGPYIGLALTLAPDAKVDDRQFDVVVREGFGRVEFLRHLAGLIWGHGRRMRRAHTLRGRAVEIDGIRCRLMVHADAEMIGFTLARFERLPAALTVLAGPAPPDEPSAVVHPERTAPLHT